jgi:predicted metal-dependent enzyme (double-stranded beta helix superfamily)
MSSFNAFVTTIDEQVRSSRALRDRVLTVRAVLREALTEGRFVLDCVDRVTAAMAAHGPAWRDPPIHADPDLDYSVRMLYWPPGYRNNPHEHLSWTVTGVVHNRFEVHVYRWQGEPNASELVVDRVIAGGPGEVGYILPPCIHNFSNPTDALSVSLHVFSGLASAAGDETLDEHPAGQTIWYPSPKKGEIMRGMRRRALLAHVAILARIGGERALHLLDETFRLGDRSVKLESVKAMSVIDPRLAGIRLRELAAISQEPARSELGRLSDRLLAAVGAR